MENNMEPPKTEDPEKLNPEPSTSRVMETTVFIKQEVFDDHNETVENVENPCIDASDVMVKLETDVDTKIDSDATNVEMEPGEITVKIEVEELNTKGKKSKKTQNRMPVSTDKVPLTDEYINSKIVQVTLTEKEREDEHRMNLAKRNHFRFKCETCACGFVARKAYDKHMVLHSEVSGDYQCAICFVHLRTPLLHYQHRLRHFRRYKCGLCSDVTPVKEKEAVASHIRQWHAHTSFQCVRCPKIFKRAAYLRLHEDQIHNKSTEYACPICNRVYYQKTNLRVHVRTHDTDVKQKSDSFICNECDAKYMLKSSLSRHILNTHTAQEAVACDTCHKWYKSRFVLQKHKQRNHNNKLIVDREFCNVCLKYFATPALLRFHTRRMHMEAGKRFECDYCKKRFMTKGEIRDHIDTVHLAIKDKVCNECGKGFTTNFLLNRHKFTHTGNKFPCASCSSTFCSMQYVQFHYKLKHLHMTREEIRNERKARLQNTTDNYSDISSTIVKRFHVLTSSEGNEILGN